MSDAFTLDRVTNKLAAITQLLQTMTSYINPGKQKNNKRNSTPAAQLNKTIQPNRSKVVQPSRSTAIGTRPYDPCRYMLLVRS